MHNSYFDLRLNNILVIFIFYFDSLSCDDVVNIYIILVCNVIYDVLLFILHILYVEEVYKAKIIEKIE